MNRSLAKECFSKEVPHLKGLFSRFVSSKGKETTWEAHFDNTKVPFMEIYNFVLPDNFEPHDQENIIISLANYPDSPPNGIYIHKNSKNIRKVEEALGGHVMSTTYYAKDNFSSIEEQGWRWVCFHMENSSWKYNFDNPLKGDCLYGYIQLLFAALNGNYTK